MLAHRHFICFLHSKLSTLEVCSGPEFIEYHFGLLAAFHISRMEDCHARHSKKNAPDFIETRVFVDSTAQQQGAFHDAAARRSSRAHSAAQQ